jgi:NAD(P)-dependent dehydrogenase (short-subunit alcohol dehydrogenase family)
MKTILLTGASGGLGIKLATQLLYDGNFVILVYNNNNSNVNELHELYKDNSLVYKCDLTSEEEIINLYNQIKEKNISIDCLINNAAIDHKSSIEEKNQETFRKVLDINTIAPFLLIKLFGKDIEANDGTIVNISSDNAIDMYDEETLEYDVSKAGLNMITNIFSKKYKVNSICFGWLDTKMNDIPEDIKPMIDFVSFDKAIEEIIKLIDTKKSGDCIIVR